MSNSNTAFLQAHGLQVSPDDLDEMVEEAVRSLPVGLYRRDHRRDLSDAEVAALKRGGLSVEPTDFGRADPLSRTTAEYAALLQASLSVKEVSERLGVSPGRIRQLLTGPPRRLFGIRGRTRWRIPAFQFTDNQIVPGWDQVVEYIDPGLHPVAVFRWAHLPSPDLVVEEPLSLLEQLGAICEPDYPLVREVSVSPLEWLASGRPPEDVIALAKSL